MSSRREFLKKGAAVTAAAVTGAAASANALTGSAGSTSKPNIILILADDMGFSDIGCFGSEISTPNLDRLAARGLRISQFYNNPRCCPSRASIMTGLYAQQAGMGMMVADFGRYPYPGYAGILSERTLTIPEALKGAGYNTAMVGKWHLAPIAEAEGKKAWPLQRGFDRFWGMIAGASVYYESPHLMNGNERLPPPSKDIYLTDLWAQHAANFVTDMAADNKPFFLYAAFNAPHWPIQAPEEDVQKYAKRYSQGWDKLREERHAKQLSTGLVESKWALTPRDSRVPAWQDANAKDWEMRRMAVYAAMVDRLDRGIGRIVDAVEKAGATENTLIVFLSDNGGNAEEIARGQRPSADPCESGMVCAANDPSVMPGGESSFQSIGIPWGNCCNTPFRLYKHYAHEGGVSTPFVANWPAVIKQGGRIAHTVGHETDLMPTFLQAAGVTYPERVAAGPIPALVGESLMPIFAGKSRSRAPIFWEHEGNKAVRDGKWKLVSRFPETWELFDMEADRTELHDLASAQPERVKRMAAMYDAWALKCGVQPWPMPQTPPADRSGVMRTPPYLLKNKQAQPSGAAKPESIQ